MKFSSATVALATLLFSASGLAQIRVFRDVDFTGPSELLVFPVNECMRLGNGWDDEISSVELEPGYECRFFWSRDCKEGDFNTVLPGRTYFGAANDKFSSYRCFKI